MLGLLITSFGLQLLAAALAARIAWRKLDRTWLFLALAFSLMAMRRGAVVYEASVLGRPINPTVEVLALAITALLVGAMLDALRRLGQASASDSAGEEADRPTAAALSRRLTWAALGVGVFVLAASLEVGFAANKANRRLIAETAATRTRRLAWALSTGAAAFSGPDAAARLLREADVRMAGDPTGLEPSACVLRPDGAVLAGTGGICALAPERTLLSAKPDEATAEGTLLALLAARRDWSGEIESAGEAAVAATSYSPALDATVLAYVSQERIAAVAKREALPWTIGLATLCGLFFPLALGLLQRAYSLTQREAEALSAALRDQEARLQQVRKMEAVGQLASGVAHNFNNILTGIMGSLGVARMEALPKAADEQIQAALIASERAAALVRQLLTFGRAAPVRPEPSAVAPILEEVAEIARNTFDRRIAILARAEPDTPPALADAAQLHQVLLNLCVNARDALEARVRRTGAWDGDPRIEMHARGVTVGPEEAAEAGAGPGRYVLLSVVDNGVGMDAETRGRIFEPFFTTKGPDKGTGLGLASAYGVLRRHGGWVRVDSEPGRGAAFHVYLPAADAATARIAEPSPAARAVPVARERTGGTVLVVDDEEPIRRLAATVLGRAGYAVILAEDGREALEEVERRGAEIDLVVLDHSMPNLSGPETLAAIRARKPDAKVILTSGYAQWSGRPDDREAETAFLSKPYSPATLLEAVRAALDEA